MLTLIVTFRHEILWVVTTECSLLRKLSDIPVDRSHGRISEAFAISHQHFVISPNATDISINYPLEVRREEY